jgi:hypothetical protein
MAQLYVRAVSVEEHAKYDRNSDGHQVTKATRNVISSGMLAIPILGGCGGDSGSSHSSNSTRQASTTCASVLDHIQQSAKDYAASDYVGGYKNADRAVHLMSGCPNKSMKLGLSGAALSARAWNEHHLTAGDSMADMRLAYALLKTCIDDTDTPSEILDLCRNTAGLNARVTGGW